MSSKYLYTEEAEELFFYLIRTIYAYQNYDNQIVSIREKIFLTTAPLRPIESTVVNKVYLNNLWTCEIILK